MSSEPTIVRAQLWEARDENEKLRAENARLREALRIIATNEYGPDGDGPDFVTIARAALAPTSPTGHVFRDDPDADEDESCVVCGAPAEDHEA